MVIFLYGSDGYRRTEKLKALLGEYRAKHPALDLLVLDLEEEPEAWERAKDFLNQPSMFVASKALVVRGGATVPEKKWIAVLKGELETPQTFVFLSDTKAPLKAFSFLLNAPARAQEFGELAGRTLELFVRREATARSLRFAPDAFSFFLSYLEASPDRSIRAVNEMDRFALAGLSAPLTRAAVEEFVSWAPSEEVFRITREMLSSSAGARKNLILLERLLAREEGGRVFNSLAYHAEGPAAVRLADYDISIKSGKLEYEEALTDFVIGSALQRR